MSSARDPESPTGEGASPLESSQLEQSLASVREALTGLRFGAITLTIHDSRVVQIDVTEKKRLRPN
jgi:hypothetical protein